MDDALKTRVLEGRDVRHDYEEHVDAVVIGTGCGGAVVGKELARAGKRVLFLERGGFYLVDRGDFDQREDNMLARIDGGRGLDTSNSGTLALTYGNNVGGASVHYWADSWRTPPDRSALWTSRHGVTGHDPETLLPYFQQIERELHIHPAPPERRNRMNRLFIRAAEQLGMPWEPVMQARKGCVGSGYCLQGCAYDAKQSQLVTGIPAALQAGARIFADCEAERILLEQGRAVGVLGRFIDRRSCRPSGYRVRVRAPVVIVAAGGYHSAPLLMRSKIPDASGQLGKNLRVNPCPQTFGVFDEDVVMWQDIPSAVGSLQYRLARYDKGRYLEGGYLLHPNQLPPATLAAFLPCFGRQHRVWMEQAHRIGSAIAWTDDVHAGHCTLDDQGYPIWHYDLSGDDVAIVRDALKKTTQVLLAAGAREVIVPDPAGTRIRDLREVGRIDRIDVSRGRMLFAAPHPCGMCRMGPDPRTAVVDCRHQVHGVPGLYVCDSSVFPTAVSVDPSMTIMAYSYVAARGLLERWPN